MPSTQYILGVGTFSVDLFHRGTSPFFKYTLWLLATSEDRTGCTALCVNSTVECNDVRPVEYPAAARASRLERKRKGAK